MRRLIFFPLAWLTERELADAMMGDLEELRSRRRSRGRLHATVLFWRVALGIVLYAIRVRLGEAVASLMSGCGRGSGGDLMHAFRTFRRKPGFAATTVVLLALGVGANTVVFSVLHSVVLQPLPYVQPERLVYVWAGTDTRSGNRHPILTGSHVHEIARLNTSLDSYAVAKPWDTTVDGVVDLVRQDRTDRLRGAFVTPNTFELLGVTASLGRTFTSSDNEAAPLAVLSGAVWREQFGRDPRVLGTSVRLANGRSSRQQPPFTVIGVLPEEVRFTYPRDTQIYLLLPWSEIEPSRALEYTLIGRLKPEVSVASAEREMTTALRDVTRGYSNIPSERMPALLDRTRAMVEPMQEHVSAEVRPGLMLLSGVAGLVLLIACLNLGLLMFARTIDRTSELAVRAALGAGPVRIIRLLALEGLVLAGVGGALGVGLAVLALPVIRDLLPAIVPRTDQISINLPVLLFATAATAASAIVCGVVPGALVLRRDLLDAIRRSGGTATGSPTAVLWRSVVMGVQVAVVFVLLVASGLLLHSFWRLQNVQLGFEADDVLTLETRLYNPKYRGRERVAAFEADLLASVRAIPGVQRASVTTAVPMRGVDFLWVVGPVNGKPKPGHMRSVDPDYFSIMNIPLRAGRLFTARDIKGSPRVMVVSESYGRLHFGSENPIGRMMEDDGDHVEIVGIVGDVRYAEVGRDPAPAFYLPRTQSPVELICLLVEPRPGMQASVADALRTVVRSLDPEQPVQGLTTIGEIVSSSTADRRLYAVASAGFAGVALLLAMAGLFGMVSRAMSERRREMAIRAALGADGRRLVQLVLRLGLLPVVGGLLIGLLGAMAGARLLRAFLFEVSPTDPTTYAAAVGAMGLVALLACLRPAFRTAGLQPMAVLRNE